MTTTNFADTLISEMRRKQSRLVVGLDPQSDHMPSDLREMSLAHSSLGHTEGERHRWEIREFCEQIIKATADVAVAFKVQIAFFERYGSTGLRILERILGDHEDKLFIIDCKRGDIGSTSKAYAEAYFHREEEEDAALLCDAITVNAYLGRDTLEPFFPYIKTGKGVFVLVKTSNPSSADLQDLKVDGIPVYERMAQHVAEWGQSFIGNHGYSSLGLVVGATYPEAAQRIRQTAPQSMFLVPGMGFQGGKLSDAKAFCGKDGCGAIFNFSRSIIYAYKMGPFKAEHPDAKYAEAARVAAEHYRVSLNEVLGDL